MEPQEVDIPLIGMNQVLPDRAGPTGRVQTMVNGQVRKFVPGSTSALGNSPTQIQIDPRDGFVSLSSAGRSVVDGTPVSLSWGTPNLLDKLGGQLVDIVGGVPRVWNGSTWTNYPNNRVVTHPLSQDVFHTATRELYVPDHSYMQGTICSVWSESLTTSTGPVTASLVGFKGSDGAWLVQPATLYAASDATTRALAKVVSDGSHFFVLWNDATLVHVNVYDVNGALLGASSGGTNIGLHGSSLVQQWDVVASPTSSPAGTVLFAQAQSYTANSGVDFTSIGWNGSAVTASSNLDATVKCAGPVGFLTNDTGNGKAYLATGQLVSSSYGIFAYEVVNLAQTHEYATGTGFVTSTVDNLTGAVVGSNPDVIISIGVIANGNAPAAHGPTQDPALRFIESWQVTRGGVATKLRDQQGLAQSSRAFGIDGNYHVVGYYQSGSGLTATARSQSVSIVGGEYMLGAEIQPVTVAPGDFVTGGTLTATGLGVSVFSGHASVGITGADTVAPYTVVSGDGSGLPPGLKVLKWTFANIPAPAVNYVYGTLNVGSSGYAPANDIWPILAGVSAHVVYTSPTSYSGQTINTGATFTGGTVTILASAFYAVENLPSLVTTATEQFYSQFTWSGDTVPANNGTFSILQVNLAAGGNSGIVVLAGSQAHSLGSFSFSMTPQFANEWSLSQLKSDSSYAGSSLIVTGDVAQPTNNGGFTITTNNGTHPITAGASGLIAEFFTSPMPSISVQLAPGQIPYTFNLPSIASSLNYTYQGALVSVQGATEPQNNGVYRILTIDTVAGTFVAQRTDGSQDQVNEAFTGAQTITIFFEQNISPLFQPTWFLVPLTGSQPIVGRWEQGQAFADWRVEADQTLGPAYYRMCLSSPTPLPSGRGLALPFRAQNVTQAQPLVSAVGQVPFSEVAIGSTVGLKVFTLANANGTAFQNASSMLIPGPMAVDFTQSGFFEDGIGLAPEAPFLVSQSTSGGTTLGLTLGATYVVQAVWEVTDDNGNLIHSIPSPALTFTMSGTNNQATYGGRTAFPLSTTGQAIANTYGVSGRNVTLSLYRTAMVGGIPTTERYKITNDLSPNQRAPYSSLNPSGFSFPDSFTWNYLDSNPDVGLTDSEDIYTDGEVPHYAAPAFSKGIGNYKNRDWVLGYDGALWMSSEQAAGENVWYHPSWRWEFPANDKPLGLGYLEDSLFVFTPTRIWQIPLGGATLPQANGVGALPTPIPLPWPNGSVAGIVLSIPNLVVYDSTAGGVWAINRSLENVWLSHAAVDILTGAVTGLAVDANQKLYVAQGNAGIVVYDPVPGIWGLTILPTFPLLIGSWNGQFVYHDAQGVNVATVGQLADVIQGTTFGIAPDVTLSSISFGNARNQKMVWGMQAIGKYLGPHRVNFVVTYEDDAYTDQVIAPFTPDPTQPWIIPFYLANEEVSSFALRVYADFVGVGSPAGAFSLEMFAAEIGVESIGLSKKKDSAAAV